MYLTEVIPGVEHSAYGLPTRQIPDAVWKHFRANAVCGGCHQRIASTVEIATRGGLVYHPSCAKRAATTPSTPRVLARLSGVALTFDAGGCNVVDRDGTPEHESFSPSAFDDSLNAGGQVLCINHDRSQTLRGVFLRLINDGGRLVFRFTLMDGPLERSILERVRSQHIRHCSIGFVPGQRQWRTPVTMHTRATLTEISLCDGRRPQWYGTSVYAESV